jgi:hypothetical protein
MKRITLVLSVMLWAVLGCSAAVAQDALQSALEYNRTNQASTWVNPDAGVSGTVVPVRTYQNAAGQPCREYQRTIIIGGREERGYGTACRQPDGTWLTISTPLEPRRRSSGAPPSTCAKLRGLIIIPHTRTARMATILTATIRTATILTAPTRTATTRPGATGILTGTPSTSLSTSASCSTANIDKDPSLESRACRP